MSIFGKIFFASRKSETLQNSAKYSEQPKEIDNTFH